LGATASVVQNEAFHRALSHLAKLVDGPVRREVFEGLAGAISVGERGSGLIDFYNAATIHLGRMAQQSPEDLGDVASCPLLPRAKGTWLSVGDALALARRGPLTYASSACPAARLVDAKRPVIVTDDSEWVEKFLHNCLALRGRPVDLDDELAYPEFDSELAESNEAKRLCSAVYNIMREAGANLRGCAVAHFRWPGSKIGKSVALTLLRRERPVPIEELGQLGHGLFSRERELVLNADHSVTKEALIAARREPEIAAYLVIKAFALDRESVDDKRDNVHIDATWEMRCRRLGN
jgi:hypothetical protein